MQNYNKILTYPLSCAEKVAFSVPNLYLRGFLPVGRHTSSDAGTDVCGVADVVGLALVFV